MQENSLLEAALEYAENGIPVFPLVPFLKNPIVDGGLKMATTDPVSIKTWWSKWPNANIGIPMGPKSGLVGLDIDYKDGCDEKFLSRIPHTVIQNSPAGGHHAFFKWPNGGIKNNLKVEKGVTVRGDGYYFVGTPSVYDSSKEKEEKKRTAKSGSYTWINGGVTGGFIEELPEWILEASKQAAESKKTFEMPEKILDGDGREDNLFKLASAMRSKKLKEEEIMEVLRVANTRCIPPKPETDLIRIAKSASKYKPGTSKEIENIVYIGFDGDEKINFPDTGKHGAPKGTIENVKELLRARNIIVRYNVISKEEEIIIPNEAYSLDNQANATLAEITSWCCRLGVPTQNLSGFLTKIADKNQYNPVISWIESVPWDGNSRLQDLYNTVQSESPIKNILMRRWLISAVAALYEPEGVSAHGVLIFRGKQYIGKTRWFQRLAPEELNVTKDGALLRPDDKDSVFQVVSKWLVELGELDATFKKSDIAQLKAFITRQKDTIRRPYARKESHYARRTVFFGSVNEKCFLNDPTGNRRFWVIETDSVDWNHAIDMQQLWAEVRQLYFNGESWFLNQEEHQALNQENEQFQQMDPIEEAIREWVGWDKEENWKPMSATEICKQYLGIKNPTNMDCKRCGAAIRKISKRKTTTSKGIVRFTVPIQPIHVNF